MLGNSPISLISGTTSKYLLTLLIMPLLSWLDQQTGSDHSYTVRLKAISPTGLSILPQLLTSPRRRSRPSIRLVVRSSTPTVFMSKTPSAKLAGHGNGTCMEVHTGGPSLKISMPKPVSPEIRRVEHCRLGREPG